MGFWPRGCGSPDVGSSSGDSTSSPAQIGEEQAKLAIGSTIWPSGNVPFCYYDGPTDDTCANIPDCTPGSPRQMNSTDPGFAAALAQIRYYIDGSWGRVGNINFANWPVCSGTGSQLAGKVVLKIFPGFGGGVRYPLGRTEIRVGFADQGNILHEFGHALGFKDETAQRSDFINCATLGGASSEPTPADPDSIMAGANYCHDNSWFDGWDVIGIKNLYGRRSKWQVFGDYDGDGKADLVSWTPSNGAWHTQRQSPYAAANLPDRLWGAPTDIPVPGDYDGDGLTDVAVWRPSNGGWYIHSSRTWDQSNLTPGRDMVTYLWGIPGDIPVQGDYDGDGKYDLAIVRPGSAYSWAIALAAGGSQSHSYGTTGDVPTPGDYDGDGKTDISVWRASSHEWYVQLSGGGNILHSNIGSAGDIPVPGDYDGDGKTDRAIWHPADGSWWIAQSGGGNVTGTGWGQSGDAPMALDFDGDGKTDAAIYRPSEGRWYIWAITGSGAGWWTLGNGNANDVPALKIVR
jgi:hypothetical protein